MDNFLMNKIRESVDIVEFIGKYIPLIKKGKNYFGLCPFHNDNNPSLSISKEKQIYKCFVCGEAGNVFNFLMKYENISFPEAIKIIANDIGISVDTTPKVEDKTRIYYDIYDLANKFYQNNLLSKEGYRALEYLKSREIDMDTIKEFGIGVSLKEIDSLKLMLTTKGYDIKILNALGLVSGEKDTYSKRIMFPLYNIKGEVNGFSGRVYNGEDTNKYLNTKETMIFKKGENLYNYHRAKDEVRKKKYLILMEGFMAVIRAHTIGVKNCVASMGTSLTNEQISLIKKLTNKIYLCLDGDNAGINATINNGSLLIDAGCDVKVIQLTDGLDPDDFIRKYGSDKFYSLIDSAINYNDFKIKNLKRGVDFNSSEDLGNYVNLVLKEISLVKDEITREIMLKNLAKETNVWYNTLEKKLNELLSNQIIVETKNMSFKKEEKTKKNKYEKTMEIIIYYMLNSKEVINLVDSKHIYFPIEKYRVLIREISYFYEKYGYINMADFASYIEANDEIKTVFNEIIRLDLDLCTDSNIILDYLMVIKNYNVALEIKRLENLIKNEVDPIEQAKISNQIMKLKIGSEDND